MRLAYLALFILGTSYAQAPELAVCKEGQCVMPQATYLQLKVMVGRMVIADQERQKEFEHQQHRADSCEAFLKGDRA